MTNSIHAAVWEWFEQCSTITKLFFNFGAIENASTTISTAGDTLLDDYIDGSQRRRYAFEVYQTHPYTTNQGDDGNIDVLEDVETIAKWVEEQCEAGNLPKLPERMTPEGVVMLDEYAGYVTALNENTARYMIPFALDYIKTKG